MSTQHQLYPDMSDVTYCSGGRLQPTHRHVQPFWKPTRSTLGNATVPQNAHLGALRFMHNRSDVCLQRGGQVRGAASLSGHCAAAGMSNGRYL